MLPIAIFLLALFFGTATAQTLTTCINQGYNLTSITGADILYYDGQYYWAIRPCGVVTTAGYCTGFPGEFCQGTNTISAINTQANVNYTVGSGAIWAQVQTNGQYGVAQFLQDGTSCGGSFDREGTIEYLCNATATTPFISSVQELTTCHYQAIIQTAAVCSQVPSTGFSTAVGTSVVSSTCGAGIYDLTSLNSADIVGTVGGGQWNIRLCGAITSASSCNLTQTPTISICQANNNIVATYQPTLNPVVYTYVAPGAISQIIQDGTPCANQNRLSNVTLYCNATATTPYLASVVESPVCHYALNIQTSAVCGSPIFSGAGFVQPGAASSTGSVVVRASSSSAASIASTAAAPTTTPASTASPSATPTANPTSTNTPATGAASTGSVITTPTAATSAPVITPPTTVNSASSSLPALASIAAIVLSMLALFA